MWFKYNNLAKNSQTQNRQAESVNIDLHDIVGAEVIFEHVLDLLFDLTQVHGLLLARLPEATAKGVLERRRYSVEVLVQPRVPPTRPRRPSTETRKPDRDGLG